MKLNIRNFIDRGRIDSVLLLHGLGSSGAEWERVINGIDEKYNIIVIDLAGFGDSPKPTDVEYTPEFHAKNIIDTLQSIGINKNIIIIAHSLSTIIAPELILLRPSWFKKAIFCSPPYYRLKRYRINPLNKINPTEALLNIYSKVISTPEEVLRWAPIAENLGLVPRAFEVNEYNIYAYSSSMQKCIIEQKVLSKLSKIRIPVTILHGKMDPVVMQEELLELMKKLGPNFNYIPVISSHRVQGLMRRKLLSLLNGKAQINPKIKIDKIIEVTKEKMQNTNENIAANISNILKK